MAEELKNLIDRIHEDAVEKATKEAEAILEKARDQAEAIRREANDKAKAILKKAEADSSVFAARGRKAIEQAARDIVIAVGQSITRTVEQFAAREVAAEMSEDFLKTMILKVISSYCERGAGEEIDLLVSEKDQEQIARFFLSKFRDALEKGVDIHPSGDVLSGFRIVIDKEHVQHDFTGDAIAAAMARILRPHLAERVKAAVSTETPTA